MKSPDWSTVLYFIVIFLFALVVIFAIAVALSSRNKDCKVIKENYEGYLESLASIQGLKQAHVIKSLTSQHYNYHNASILECTNFLVTNYKNGDLYDIAPIHTTECARINESSCAFYLETHNLLIISFGSDLPIWRTYEQTAPTELRNYQKGMLVNVGVLEYYKTVRSQIQSVYNKYGDKTMMIFTGHGMGGSVATLAALDFASIPQEPHVYVFGSPCVGNMTFARIYNKLLDSSWHVYNISDQIVNTWVPPVAEGYYYEHSGIPIAFTYNLVDYKLNHTLAYKNVIIDQLNVPSAQRNSILSETDLITSAVKTPKRTPKRYMENKVSNSRTQKNDLISFDLNNY